jgi:hypothetical protein
MIPRRMKKRSAETDASLDGDTGVVRYIALRF